MLKYLAFLSIISLSISLLIGCTKNIETNDPKQNEVRDAAIDNLNNNEARNLIAEETSLVVLDVRTEEEYQDGHLENSKLIPLGQLEGRLNELNKDIPILVYCRSGNRSLTASEILINNGYSKIYNLKDGIRKWDGEVVTE